MKIWTVDEFYQWLQTRNRSTVLPAVEGIVEQVRQRGDDAVREFAEKWDQLRGRPLTAEVPVQLPSNELVDSIKLASERIRTFAQWQLAEPFRRDLGGIEVGQVVRPLGRVGCYVPGGRYPLPSTLLMTVVPAQVAGVPEIVCCSPNAATETLWAARAVGLDAVWRVGGAHAIAAMALGTQTIPKVDKIVGPGNAYVAAAKQVLRGEVEIDSVAGPSEVVIAASEGRPDWIASDLLAQAEHDTDAVAILLSDSTELIQETMEEVGRQLLTLPEGTPALGATVAAVKVTSMAEAMALVNSMAPEHLCLLDDSLLDEVQNAGSIFLGSLTPEPLGDYMSGPNHVLPTAGHARYRGGLSVMDFVKVITVQKASTTGIATLGRPVATLARAERLEAHARSVEARL